MDYLIKKSSSTAESLGATVSEVKLPTQSGGDKVFVGDKRPLDLGDYVLAKATEITEPLDAATQKRGETAVVVVGDTVTVTYTAVDLTQGEINERDRRIPFDAFEGRFTAQEWDDATDYSLNAAPEMRRKIKQGLQRATARNSVDLLDPKTDAFLTILVNGGVITGTRKTAILTP